MALALGTAPVCAGAQAVTPAGGAVPAPSTGSAVPDAARAPQTRPALSPDSVRRFLVFAPTTERWFVAASRAKRLLLDIGRVDLEVRKDSAVAAAYRAAVASAAPVKVGALFTLRGPWGTEQVRARAVDTWNGRIVLVLEGSAALDSAAQARSTVVASAFREVAPAPTATSAPPTAGRAGAASRTAVPSAGSGGVTPPVALTPGGMAPCVRVPVAGVYAERVKVLRDSLEQALRLLPGPPYERLTRRVTAHASQAHGCYGDARVLLAVSLRAGAAEWSHERLVAVDTLGRAHAIAVDDLRFKVHDLLHALDADGDGVDDVATVARTERAGGTTILRYDPTKRRLVRLAAGFVWEDR